MKQKTIIGLKGTANVGKSMTLSSLGRQLRNARGITSVDVTRGDYWAVFDYQGKKVGIQTYGDHVSHVRSGVTGFLNERCDIIVIASKTTGATLNHVNQVATTNDYRVFWARPYEVRDRSIPVEDMKEYCANHLRLMIDDIISGIL